MINELIASPVILQTGNVLLDFFQPEDVTERYIGWLNDSNLMRYTEARFRRHTVESASQYVASSNMGNVSRLWRILIDGEYHVGNIRLSDVNWAHRRASIAILIGERSVWGRGVGARAVALASWYGLSLIGLHKLTAGMYSENLGSIKAFENAGYHKEAELQDHFFLEDRPQNGILMACFKDDLTLLPDRTTS